MSAAVDRWFPDRTPHRQLGDLFCPYVVLTNGNGVPAATDFIEEPAATVAALEATAEFGDICAGYALVDRRGRVCAWGRYVGSGSGQVAG